ncbi:hypothetical protein XELAEV_18019136mg [Xenopus laevis]|uniref:Uncharacterized protein n=1 Tax=Xenopus laevis TaxID=8355 RepID=A0A974DG67_XENLA|nr:hypothetical protein XELAEV_18019136mg [Xenopus laevis]
MYTPCMTPNLIIIHSCRLMTAEGHKSHQILEDYSILCTLVWIKNLQKVLITDCAAYNMCVSVLCRDHNTGTIAY